MQYVLKEEFSQLFRRIAEDLDIPDRLYEDAILKYDDVGSWLAADGSELQEYSPEIYPQGSFRLGTMIKPHTNRDEYDIDLVCHLDIKKENTTQEKLKQMVGNRLGKRPNIAEILTPSRRCWNLDYPRQFHMDVLPAIPNEEWPPTGIFLTDTDLRAWQRSNPKLYAEWFYGCMKPIFEERRQTLAKSYQINIEEVPIWQVKTPLQRAIQLLKRHRDMYFQKDKENRPVSIIITTLAAKAYNNQADLYDALLDIVRDMPKFIEFRDEKWWVPNPVEPRENFADKWNEKPERCRAFFTWLQKVDDDFTTAIQQESLNKSFNILAPSLGQETISKAAASLGISSGGLPIARSSGSSGVPDLGNSSHCLQPLWPVRTQYKASVKGGIYKSRYNSKKSWDLANRSVPKGVALRFEVQTNVSAPYKVKWQVVNTGEEARRENGLRGDFYDGESASGRVRWETTEYAGTHWIEAFIIKDGVCVARSGRKHVRIRG